MGTQHVYQAVMQCSAGLTWLFLAFTTQLLSRQGPGRVLDGSPRRAADGS